MTSQRTYETPDAPGTYSDHYLLVDKSGAVSATKVRVDAFKDWLLAGYTSGYVGGNIATITVGTAAAGQKVVTVLSTAGFVAGGFAAYSLVDGTFEYNLIATVTDPTHLLLTTNIGATGIGNGVFVGMISPEQYASANAIPHAGSLVMPDTIEYANAGRFHVGAYGAYPGADEATNTAGINAAIAAAKAAGGGTVQLGVGTYAYDGALNLCETANIKLVGATGHFGTILECHNTDGACIEAIGSKQITFEDFKIVGHATDTPSVGIWTGRTDTGVYAAGEDTSQIVGNRLRFDGSFTKACVYNTGCESNHWTNCYLYPTNTAVLAGFMFDYQNTLGLTPEHTTLSNTYPQVLSVIEKCLVATGETSPLYSPVYVVHDYPPQIYDSYLYAKGAPAIYLKGGTLGPLVVAGSGVEGTPSYLIHCDRAVTGGGFTYSNVYGMDLQQFGGAYSSSGYSIYADDDTILRDSETRSCNFKDDVRFYQVENCKFDALGFYGAPDSPTLIVTAWAINSHFRVGYAEGLTLSNGLINVSVDYDTDADYPGTGYLLLAGNKGLAIGGAPAAANQAVIRRMYYSSATWDPGAIANGASAHTYIAITGLDVSAGTWFCQAAYTGITATIGWVLSSVPYGGDGVAVTLVNFTGGSVTPTGTLHVVAMKIMET